MLNVLLAVEVAVAGRVGAKIVVRLSRRASDVFVEVTGEGAPASSVPDGSPGEFGFELQRRVMERLAEGQGAVLTSDLSGEGGPTFSLVLSAAESADRPAASSVA